MQHASGNVVDVKQHQQNPSQGAKFVQDFPAIKATNNTASGNTDSLVDVLSISCDDCVMRATAACDDCVVSFFCEDSGAQAVVLDLEEQRTLRMLANAGLVPTLRHRAVS
ncbi:MAG: hypothetical protein O3A62_04030 [Actinomycetota bacterium]|nr:hypothetical protein [Actinomycetota bacterium]MDA3004222.1 hypothetical protein [Actinomycetota bacterium]